jgi:hypothetical protein
MTLDSIVRRASPAVIYGRDIPKTSRKTSIYNDTLIPYFLLENSGEPRNVREFLIQNEIGSVFDELYPGMEVKVQRAGDHRATEFLRHPEA